MRPIFRRIGRRASAARKFLLAANAKDLPITCGRTDEVTCQEMGPRLARPADSGIQGGANP